MSNFFDNISMSSSSSSSSSSDTEETNPKRIKVAVDSAGQSDSDVDMDADKPVSFEIPTDSGSSMDSSMANLQLSVSSTIDKTTPHAVVKLVTAKTTKDGFDTFLSKINAKNADEMPVIADVEMLCAEYLQSVTSDKPLKDTIDSFASFVVSKASLDSLSLEGDNLKARLGTDDCVKQVCVFVLLLVVLHHPGKAVLAFQNIFPEFRPDGAISFLKNKQLWRVTMGSAMMQRTLGSVPNLTLKIDDEADVILSTLN